MFIKFGTPPTSSNFSVAISSFVIFQLIPDITDNHKVLGSLLVCPSITTGETELEGTRTTTQDS